jgi:hypothetical protein
MTTTATQFEQKDELQLLLTWSYCGVSLRLVSSSQIVATNLGTYLQTSIKFSPVTRRRSSSRKWVAYFSNSSSYLSANRHTMSQISCKLQAQHEMRRKPPEQM